MLFAELPDTVPCVVYAYLAISATLLCLVLHCGAGRALFRLIGASKFRVKSKALAEVSFQQLHFLLELCPVSLLAHHRTDTSTIALASYGRYLVGFCFVPIQSAKRCHAHLGSFHVGLKSSGYWFGVMFGGLLRYGLQSTRNLVSRHNAAPPSCFRKLRHT